MILECTARCKWLFLFLNAKNTELPVSCFVANLQKLWQTHTRSSLNQQSCEIHFIYIFRSKVSTFIGWRRTSTSLVLSTSPKIKLNSASLYYSSSLQISSWSLSLLNILYHCSSGRFIPYFVNHNMVASPTEHFVSNSFF